MNLMSLFNSSSPESKEFATAMEALLVLPEMVKTIVDISQKLETLIAENAGLKTQIELLAGQIQLENQSKVY